MSSSSSRDSRGDIATFPRPTVPFQQECKDILYTMDLDARATPMDTVIFRSRDGFSVAGHQPCYSRALFARVVNQAVASAILQLNTPGLHDDLLHLVSLGPGHSINRLGCDLAFMDKCEAVQTTEEGLCRGKGTMLLPQLRRVQPDDQPYVGFREFAESAVRNALVQQLTMPADKWPGKK